MVPCQLCPVIVPADRYLGKILTFVFGCYRTPWKHAGYSVWVGIKPLIRSISLNSRPASVCRGISWPSPQPELHHEILFQQNKAAKKKNQNREQCILLYTSAHIPLYITVYILYLFYQFNGWQVFVLIMPLWHYKKYYMNGCITIWLAWNSLCRPVCFWTCGPTPTSTPALSAKKSSVLPYVPWGHGNGK